MIERSEPYIGVSGVVSPRQQEYLYVAVGGEELTNSFGRYIGMGVKATHKPQYDDIENKYGRLWYPVGDEIEDALDPGIDTFNIAQMYLEPSNLAEDSQYPTKFIDKLFDRTKNYLHAIQIDLLRYEEEPEKYRGVIKAMANTGLSTIIQCHRFAMQAGPAKAIEDMKRLVGDNGVSYILFDASHGTGVEMDSPALIPFLDAAYNDTDLEAMGANFGIAGGLGPYNVERIMPQIVKRFPHVSWDAEGQLHDKIGDGGDGSLNMRRTQGYLFRSIEIINTYSY